MSDFRYDIQILPIIKEFAAIEGEGVELRISFTALVILGIALIVVEGTADMPAILLQFVRTDLRSQKLFVTFALSLSYLTLPPKVLAQIPSSAP